MSTYIVGAVVLAILVLAGRSMYKDNKNGSCASCGGGCTKCKDRSGEKTQFP